MIRLVRNLYHLFLLLYQHHSRCLWLVTLTCWPQQIWVQCHALARWVKCTLNLYHLYAWKAVRRKVSQTCDSFWVETSWVYSRTGFVWHYFAFFSCRLLPRFECQLVSQFCFWSKRNMAAINPEPFRSSWYKLASKFVIHFLVVRFFFSFFLWLFPWLLSIRISFLENL